MKNTFLQAYLNSVLKNMPSDWLSLTTHRLDIYNEEKAKTDFLEQFQSLYNADITATEALNNLPTAYDYIRLGHPLSSVLEWTIAQELDINPSQVISFSSQTIGILAILRQNAQEDVKTRILYEGGFPANFDTKIIEEIYEYNFELVKREDHDASSDFEGSIVLVSNQQVMTQFELEKHIDFYINTQEFLGSILVINTQNAVYIPVIQHVRRRETIAMTPINCYRTLQAMVTQKSIVSTRRNPEHKQTVTHTINSISNTATPVVVGSSGLSVQYAIMMGLVHQAKEEYPGKPIRFIVPPNCYGGTNDQARRVAASIANVAIEDLPVDRDNDMVSSVEVVLEKLALEDAIPYIIAEIPTNPRVEVPELEALQAALAKSRKTREGNQAIAPVFILDQTFCPQVHFLGDQDILGKVQALAYASGSKFPSGGKCTSGYCVANTKAAHLMKKIDLHLNLCDNEATAQQYQILAEQMPSMVTRIAAAYKNTREFVTYIEETLPEAKINFVSKELAAQGFTPSVFSLDLPTKGTTPEEKESFKRALNHKLISAMITQIPSQSKYCVSYGQLKGVYWTIPATSTQGTTKEGDKDYIIRASFAPEVDMIEHKKVFKKFVAAL